mmetsp:Transcript_32095/g.43956  ORF Transcript_32095/g.43956 Transcript_32095/m.43956 type:complete len:252 (-) Transcript_32095:8-763(-)
MPFCKLSRVKFGSFQHHDLADQNILQGEDSVALFLDLTTNGIRDKLSNQVLNVGRRDFITNDFEHLLADLTDLRRLSITSSLGLVHSSLGESQTMNTEGITVSGLDINVCLNQTLPFANKRAKLVGGQVHSIERSQAVAALNILDLELELSVMVALILIQISKRSLNNTTLQSLRSNLSTSSTIDHSLAHVGILKQTGGSQVIPILLGEGVGGLLLETLLFSKLLVFTDSHGAKGLSERKEEKRKKKEFFS